MRATAQVSFKADHDSLFPSSTAMLNPRNILLFVSISATTYSTGNQQCFRHWHCNLLFEIISIYHPGALHGRRDGRLLLVWLAVRQSWTQAVLLHCCCSSGELKLGQMVGHQLSQALVGLLSGLIHNYWAFVLLR